MAVVTLYMSDRDKENKTFTSKKEADNYDKMLDLGYSLTEFLNTKIDDLSEDLAEEIGMLLAKNSDLLMSACKGKPSVLLESATNSDSKDSSKPK